ncbi:hypothetical protein [Rurimicrobium arvi]|uniref:Uncharacterized protein n=1 Tax=Rurimicrobium arvi TaxID=2049916 RepID=A0ABP8MQN1_9BACT
MKKIRFVIMATGLVAIACTMQSCKKDNAGPKATNTRTDATKNSTAKTLTTTEVNGFITEVNNFLPYVESVANNPDSQLPGTLPSEISDEDAIRYLENAFNFTYALQENQLQKVYIDNFSITLPKNVNGKVNMKELASKFIEAYNHVKQTYLNLACPEDEKVLRVVDVDLVSSNNGSLSLKLTSTYEWHFDATTAVPSATAISVPSGQWARFGSMGGNNITSVDPLGSGGAPEIVSVVLRANYGGYLFLKGATPKSKYSRFLVSNIEDVFFGFGAWDSKADLPSSAPRNPWLLKHWGVALSGMPVCLKDYNSLVFNMAPHAKTPPFLPFPDPLTDDLLNYMITWNEWVLRDKEVKLGKSLYSLTFDEGLISTLMTSSYAMYTTYANVYDRLSTPPLSRYTPVSGIISVF